MNEFYIGQIFEGDYPEEASEWCKKNGATIAEQETAGEIRQFIVVEIEKPIPTKAELTAFVSAEADKVAYGGITVVANGQEYLFKTDPANISRCGAVLPVYETMADDQVIPWEVWKDDLIFMLPVSKVQFKNGYLFGVQMTVQVQTVKGALCAEIQSLTDEQLADADYIMAFRENAVIQLAQVNTVFKLDAE